MTAKICEGQIKAISTGPLTKNAREMAETTAPNPQLRLATTNGHAPRTPGPHRRLFLVVSHSLPPDALDRCFESAEAAYPHLRHWVVQIKQAARADTTALSEERAVYLIG